MNKKHYDDGVEQMQQRYKDGYHMCLRTQLFEDMGTVLQLFTILLSERDEARVRLDQTEELIRQNKTVVLDLVRKKAAEWHQLFNRDLTGNHDDKVYYAKAAREIAKELEAL